MKVCNCILPYTDKDSCKNCDHNENAYMIKYGTQELDRILKESDDYLKFRKFNFINRLNKKAFHSNKSIRKSARSKILKNLIEIK